MSAEAALPAPPRKTRDPERYSSAGLTPDPWVESARLEYGADRSYASIVRAEVLTTPADRRAHVEDRLLRTLATPGRTDCGLAFLCQMCALVGTAKTVAALAPLLRDEKTADAARYALQAIPGPEAGAALRNALGVLTGITKSGVIGSLAIRGDTGARPALLALRNAPNEPAVVREAADRALAHLANLKADSESQ